MIPGLLRQSFLVPDTDTHHFFLIHDSADCRLSDRDFSGKYMVIGTSAIVGTELDGAEAGRFPARLQVEMYNMK